jgi:hypothetical protein
MSGTAFLRNGNDRGVTDAKNRKFVRHLAGLSVVAGHHQQTSEDRNALSLGTTTESSGRSSTGSGASLKYRWRITA